MCRASECGEEFDADSHDGLAGRRTGKLRWEGNMVSWEQGICSATKAGSGPGRWDG